MTNKKVNAQKGKQGFQPTTKGADAPTPGNKPNLATPPLATQDDVQGASYLRMHAMAVQKQAYAHPVETQPYVDEVNARIREAQSDAVSSDRLAVLALDDEYLVRHQVARNLRTPHDSLNTLSHDPDSFVREGVLMNPNTPEDTKRTFLHDRDPDVQRLAEEQLKW